jgi:methionyl-tRNA synthetase
MNKLAIIIILMLGAAFVFQPHDATPQQRIVSIQAQVSKAADQAKPYVLAAMEKVKQVNQIQPAAVQHSQAVASSPRPVNPQLEAWITAEADRQLAERKAEYEKLRGSHADDVAIDLATNQKEP